MKKLIFVHIRVVINSDIQKLNFFLLYSVHFETERQTLNLSQFWILSAFPQCSS